MKKFLIDDISEVACGMYDSIVDDGHSEVMFVGLYDDAVAVIKNLLMFDETIPYHISIEPEDWDGYDKEYYVTLDDEMNVWCEKAYQENHSRYLEGETGCLFVADDCNSAILKRIYCDEDNMYEVSYDTFGDDQCDGNCECCHFGTELENSKNEELSTESKSEYHNISKTKDGRIAGFSTSWTNEKDGETSYSSFSYYGDNEVIVKRLAREFGIDI